MSIDWITVAAQIANFLALVWLLKRFLYRPILDGIDAREAEITAWMQEAAQQKAEAAAVEAEYHEKLRALHVAQSEMQDKVRKEAEAQRDALLAEAQQRMEHEHENWQAHLDDSARKYAARLHAAGADALLSLTRKALNDLADETLEARIAHQLVRKIRPMTEELRSAAGQAGAATITSRDPLPPEVQEGLTAELAALFPGVRVGFETDSEQAPGLVLRMGGAQVAWSIDSYVDGLDALISDQLSRGADLKVQGNGH